MSRKLLAFLLSELTVVRLICQRPHCMGITEITIEKLGERYIGQSPPGCPLCSATFAGVGDGHNNHLSQLSKAIVGLRNASAGIQIEFVLPDDSGM